MGNKGVGFFMDVNAFKERLANLSDADLAQIFNDNFTSYTEEALQVVQEEMSLRGLKPVNWYCRRGNQQYGPMTVLELLELGKTGQLRYNDFIWREGWHTWVHAAQVPYFFPAGNSEPQQNQMNTQNAVPSSQENSGGSAAGLTAAQVLFYILASLWCIVSMVQLISALDTMNPYDLLLAGWNIVVTIAFFVIPTGIQRRQLWGYNWGVGTSGINLVLDIIQIVTLGAYILILFIPIELTILILLLANKKYFNK